MQGGIILIFVVLGSQKFQFNRLLKSIDDAVNKGKITQEIFAQTGYSDYQPKNYEFCNFIDREEYKEKLRQADIVICHGGTGVIVEAVKNEKKVIAIARLAQYNEHVDDHQTQIIHQFANANMIAYVENADDIPNKLNEIENVVFEKYVSNQKVINEYIKDYIDGI